ncbi:STAS domain-containing protein [Streptosporangium sp. NBC_01755]|uniref:STAS domain-containing protein n=1 Tax=Streptosporangium sp. NBC_01755 TaxID=2975949 RepID=UPI002DD98D3E|nr:STAS domain-containing protein [Streptosporangium sp. NBC_01755]WSD03438.1 STAS domain-containing protein [Streptosporangium sp. NBC_01755]
MVGEVNHGSLRILFTDLPTGVRCEGDVDLCTRHVLVQALAMAAERTGDDLHADLHGVDFVDVGGLRVLAEAAFGMASDRRLVVGGLRPHAWRIAELCGWAEVLATDPENVSRSTHSRSGERIH